MVLYYVGLLSSIGYSTNWKTFGELKGQSLSGDKADYFTAKGTIMFLKKDNCMYMVSVWVNIPALTFLS